MNIYLGNNEISSDKKKVSGEFTEIAGEKYYRIGNYHEMPDFFINVVSDTDLWMFISSNGSLTAGRKDRDNALFPYYTVDKIHDYEGKAGSRSVFLVKREDKTFLWEPFTDESRKIYDITRNIFKSIFGNKVIFEEVNDSLGLVFSYSWNSSEQFGFVKKSSLVNISGSKVKIELADGIINILPSGTGYAFQNEFSNLLDAYKKGELIRESTLALYMLSSIPVDRAEPSEALKATTVWSEGPVNDATILLSESQLPEFMKGKPVHPESDTRALKGAYFISAGLELNKGESSDWMTVAEVNQDSARVADLTHFLKGQDGLAGTVNEDIGRGTERLNRMVAKADAFQMTDTVICYARHYMNVLYNIMRGGVFMNDYRVNTEDFRQFLWQMNRMVSKEFQAWLGSLRDDIPLSELYGMAEATGNADLLRITHEYLPLTFSRRHGDPSRPWNRFSIQTRDDNGNIRFNYEGNWRDIFQNWEALCYSFPEFTEGMICKFVNASTIDGYNPYRIMREGIDWECPDPAEPWSYIGYWGDHQIIYLQKLFEISDHFHPGRVDRMLEQEIFTYANVPYRIKPYEDIVKNPKDTVTFDPELDRQIRNEASHLGADARLVNENGVEQIYRVNLAEKVLVTLLTKMSNFIPEAGIWLNTQRPEWNDANNALVGNGASLVTLYYLRRFIKFWEEKFTVLDIAQLAVSEEVAELFDSISGFLETNLGLIEKGFSDADRRRFADSLGRAHEKYRSGIYRFSFSGEKEPLRISDLVRFLNVSLMYVDQTTRASKRDDGLYHAYNLISFRDDKVSIRHLYEMLEGQVAVLSSGLLDASECLAVLDALKESKMFRRDQYSYLLYPDRELPRFTEKNAIPADRVEDSHLLTKLVNDGETSVIKRDKSGNYHFNSDFRNAALLEQELDELRHAGYGQLIDREKEDILQLYEDIFDHQSFTGRSGTFFGYEGLGSIYWHMVSKLLLATQECFFNALDEGAEPGIAGKIKDHYYEIKAGIGLYKSPDRYGAFPMDAYSHTPSGAGVKQPGLTGQVKEDVISRFGELGVRIKAGEVVFDLSLMNHEEILNDNSDFGYYAPDSGWHTITLGSGQWAMTFCQVPVVFSASDNDEVNVVMNDDRTVRLDGHRIPRELSEKIFERNGDIGRIEVSFKKAGFNGK